jgi:phosphate transport system substrate-binding protein
MKTRPEQRLTWRAAVRRAEFVASKILDSSGPLEQAVTGEPTAIAINGMSSAKKRDVEILELDGKYPSDENMQSGNYPLYRPLYLVYNQSSPNAVPIKDFIQFADSREGRDVIRNQRYRSVSGGP